MKSFRLAALALSALVLAAPAAQAQDIGSLAGLAIGALTNGGLGNRAPYGYNQGGYGQPAYGAYGAYGNVQRPYGNPYQAYGAGYGNGGYGGYGGYDTCRIVKARGLDAYGNVIVQRRRICD